MKNLLELLEKDLHVTGIVPQKRPAGNKEGLCATDEGNPCTGDDIDAPCYAAL